MKANEIEMHDLHLVNANQLRDIHLWNCIVSSRRRFFGTMIMIN